MTANPPLDPILPIDKIDTDIPPVESEQVSPPEVQADAAPMAPQPDTDVEANVAPPSLDPILPIDKVNMNPPPVESEQVSPPEVQADAAPTTPQPDASTPAPEAMNEKTEAFVKELGESYSKATNSQQKIIKQAAYYLFDPKGQQEISGNPFTYLNEYKNERFSDYETQAKSILASKNKTPNVDLADPANVIFHAPSNKDIPAQEWITRMTDADVDKERKSAFRDVAAAAMGKDKPDFQKPLEAGVETTISSFMSELFSGNVNIIGSVISGVKGAATGMVMAFPAVTGFFGQVANAAGDWFNGDGWDWQRAGEQVAFDRDSARVAAQMKESGMDASVFKSSMRKLAQGEGAAEGMDEIVARELRMESKTAGASPTVIEEPAAVSSIEESAAYNVDSNPAGGFKPAFPGAIPPSGERAI